jgi:hypothetical protein
MIVPEHSPTAGQGLLEEFPGAVGVAELPTDHGGHCCVC